jgi:hypothetical protein
MNSTFQVFSEFDDECKLDHYRFLKTIWDDIKNLHGQDKADDMQIAWYEADDKGKKTIEVDTLCIIATESVDGIRWSKRAPARQSHNLEYYDNYYHLLLRRRNKSKCKEFRPVKSIEI